MTDPETPHDSDAQAAPSLVETPAKPMPPKWWHSSGKKFHRPFSGPIGCYTILTTGAAHLKITHLSRDDKFCLEWDIYHAMDSEVHGKIVLTRAEMGRAFIDELGDSFIDLAQGLYVRQGRYVNIPCSGTGMNGDPNLSVEINDEVLRTVSQLLEINKKLVA